MTRAQATHQAQLKTARGFFRKTITDSKLRTMTYDTVFLDCGHSIDIRVAPMLRYMKAHGMKSHFDYGPVDCPHCIKAWIERQMNVTT